MENLESKKIEVCKISGEMRKKNLGKRESQNMSKSEKSKEIEIVIFPNYKRSTF